jgi:hypothetical protein
VLTDVDELDHPALSVPHRAEFSHDRRSTAPKFEMGG